MPELEIISQPPVTECYDRALVVDFAYRPYSFLYRPELRDVHDMTMEQCAGMNNLEAANWLYSLADWQSASDPLKDQFDLNYLDDSAPSLNCERPETPGQQVMTAALLVYSAAKLEHLLRMQGIQAPEGTDNGIGLMLASTLGRLSNTYREQYFTTPEKPHLLVLAHDLAMHALRYKAPDHHGYRQTLGHLLHLQVHLLDPTTQEGFEEYEERLKLALSLQELGSGPEGWYIQKHLVRDLIKLYKNSGQAHKSLVLEAHLRNIPTVLGDLE